MPKVILFSDLHMRDDNLGVTLGVVRAIREEARKLRIKRVGFLGDWFHLRYTVDVRMLNAIRDELDEWDRAGLHLRFLPGNHDQVDVIGRHAFEVFGHHPAVDVYTLPTKDEDGLWIPYRRDLEEVRRLLRSHRPAVEHPVFWHGPMLGAMMNNFRPAESGLVPEDFEDYSRVFLGHFHKRQSFGDGGFCQYIGSPWQTRADEAGQAKGFAVWNPERDELTFHDREWGPVYRVATISTVEEAHALAAQGGRIRVKVSGDSLEEIAKALADAGADATVEPEKIEATGPRVAAAGATFREHAERMVNDLHGDHDPEALLRTFEEITA